MHSDVYIEDLLAPNYDALLEDVLAHRHSQYMLKGGRGSLKSSFTGFVIPLIMLEHPDVNALILRKTAKTLRDSVFGQMQFAIDKLGLSDEFTCRVSPMQIKREKTGQVIHQSAPRLLWRDVVRGSRPILRHEGNPFRAAIRKTRRRPVLELHDVQPA